MKTALQLALWISLVLCGSLAAASVDDVPDCPAVFKGAAVAHALLPDADALPPASFESAPARISSPVLLALGHHGSVWNLQRVPDLRFTILLPSAADSSPPSIR